MDTQVCNTCKVEKTEDAFYLQDGFRRFKRCKACISSAKVKKPKGFAQLPVETQQAIRLALTDRTQKIISIARDHDVPYANLCYWIRKKTVV